MTATITDTMLLVVLHTSTTATETDLYCYWQYFTIIIDFVIIYRLYCS